MKNTLLCPSCKIALHIDISQATKLQAKGYSKARITVLEKMRTYCTEQMHKERAKEMAYCNLCHKRIC